MKIRTSDSYLDELSSTILETSQLIVEEEISKLPKKKQGDVQIDYLRLPDNVRNLNYLLNSIGSVVAQIAKQVRAERKTAEASKRSDEASYAARVDLDEFYNSIRDLERKALGVAKKED